MATPSWAPPLAAGSDPAAASSRSRPSRRRGYSAAASPGGTRDRPRRRPRAVGSAGPRSSPDWPPATLPVFRGAAAPGIRPRSRRAAGRPPERQARTNGDKTSRASSAASPSFGPLRWTVTSRRRSGNAPGADADLPLARRRARDLRPAEPASVSCSPGLVSRLRDPAVDHFWRADPGHFSRALKAQGEDEGRGDGRPPLVVSR